MFENFTQHVRNDGEGKLGILEVVPSSYVPIRFYWVTIT